MGILKIYSLDILMSSSKPLNQYTTGIPVKCSSSFRQHTSRGEELCSILCMDSSDSVAFLECKSAFLQSTLLSPRIRVFPLFQGILLMFKDSDLIYILFPQLCSTIIFSKSIQNQKRPQVWSSNHNQETSAGSLFIAQNPNLPSWLS